MHNQTQKWVEDKDNIGRWGPHLHPSPLPSLGSLGRRRGFGWVMTIVNACIGLVGKICLKPRGKGMGFRKIDAFNYVLLAARVTKPDSFLDR